MTTRRFRPDPGHRPHGARALLRWGAVDPLLGRRRVAPAGPPAPRVAANLERIREDSERARVTWIGHASFLVTLARRHVLIDPVFSRRVGILYPRHGEPGLGPRDLPPLACLLITHNHFDHLDARSVRAVPREVPAVVPAGLARWFRRRSPRAVTELEWWGSTEIAGLRITLVPARHWSGRRFVDANRTLWGGFVIEAVRGDRAEAPGSGSVYHAGDSAWFDGFAQIGRRFPRIDVAMLPIGGYTPAWFMEPNHLNPEQAGRAFEALGARCLVPMHWGAFRLADEPLAEPVERLRRWWAERGPRDGRRLAILAVGETLDVATGEVGPTRGA